MKKKIIILAAALAIVFSANAWGVGLGIQGVGGITPGPGNPTVGGLWGTVKFADAPYIGFGADFYPNTLRLGFTADWWLVDNRLAGPLRFYLGLGPYLGVTLANQTALAIGVRLPIGLHLFVVKPFELFVEIAPSLGMYVTPNVGLDWGLRGAFGLRFWF